MNFVGPKMQFCWTKNVRLNIRNVGLNWFFQTKLHFVGLN
jgi:hypothetical protein